MSFVQQRKWFSNPWQAGLIYLILFLSAFLPLILMRWDDSEPLSFALKFLSGPLLLLALFIGIKSERTGTALFTQRNGAKVGRAATWFLLLCMVVLATALSTGWVLAANALIPPQEDVLIDGTIVSQYRTFGKSRAYHLVVKTVSRTYNFSVSWSEYNAVTVGAPYHQYWKHGGLGLIYRYKY